MKNEQLSKILDDIKLSKCENIIHNHIYYTNRKVLEICDGKRQFEKYEFLIVAENNIKKSIILRCGTVDLHWYVKKEYRNQHVLSSALKTNIINQIWPENKSVTCCYEIGDSDDKYDKTRYLAKIAGLTVKEK